MKNATRAQKSGKIDGLLQNKMLPYTSIWTELAHHASLATLGIPKCLDFLIKDIQFSVFCQD